MSLTDLLKHRNHPARLLLEERLTNMAELKTRWKSAGPATILPRPQPPGAAVPWGPLGMAFDYRLRYYFAVTHPRGFHAAVGGAIDLEPLVPQHHDEPSEQASASEEGCAAYWQVAASLDELVPQGNPTGTALDDGAERRLCALCFLLALYDAVGRGSPAATSALFAVLASTPDATADQQLELVDDVWVDDLVALSRAFSTSAALAQLRELNPIVANPIFAGSGDVDGADGDLLVGDMLVEVKTTKGVERPNQWIYQLVAYALLDYDNAYDIKQFGLYLSRSAALVTWSIDELFAPSLWPTDWSTLRAEFRAAVS